MISLLDHPDPADFGRLLARLEVANDVGEVVAATIISFEEQSRGWLSYINSRRQVADQVDAYLRLQRMIERFGRMDVLPFNERAAADFSVLRKSNRRIGTMDLKIAATAIAHDALLLSGNARDFTDLPGLRFEAFGR